MAIRDSTRGPAQVLFQEREHYLHDDADAVAGRHAG